jgi:phosphatidylinositol glycan class B
VWSMRAFLSAIPERTSVPIQNLHSSETCMDSVERKAFLLLAIVLVVTAYTGYGYFELDEHFQVIEFAGSKLGIVPVQSLPWEYSAEIRPWLQPAFFAGLCKLLSFLGIENRFVWTFVLRLCCAAFGFWAVLSVYRIGRQWFPGKRIQRRLLWLCTTLGFLPFLLVRTSSENLSASFFTIGVSLLLVRMDMSRPDGSAIPNRIFLLSGLLLGLAFQFRYQIILMIAGFGLWLVLYAHVRWKSVLCATAGFLFVFGIGLLTDRYGYGEFTFTFLNYFRVNLIEKKTADFGADPFYAYIYIVLENFFAPVTLIFLAALIAFWIRRPRHVLFWITLPFFIFHSFIGHKEVRFLFPLVPLILIIPHLVFYNKGRFALPEFLRKPFLKRVYKWVCLYNWIWLALFCVFPICVESYIKHQRFIYEHRSSIGVYYAAGYNPYRRKELTYSFYRPADLRIIDVADLATMASVAGKKPDEDFYFFAQMPYLDNWPDALRQRTVLVNPEYYFFQWPWLLEFSTPILKNLHSRFEEVQCPSLFKISASVSSKVAARR